MILAKVLNSIYKKGGIILEDSSKQKYIIGNPKKDNPITLKLLKDNLKWKLVLDPEIEFPEAYMRNEIVIENASLKEFLMELVKNLGRKEGVVVLLAKGSNQVKSKTKIKMKRSRRKSYLRSTKVR